MYTAPLAMSAHTGAGCADSSSTPGANPRAPPASGWHPVCIPTPEAHRTAQTDCSTLQDSPTKQLPTASPCSRIIATLTLRQLPAGWLLDGSASSLPLSPTHFPLLFSLGELRATQTICHPSEHPPGSDGFRETGSEVSGRTHCTECFDSREWAKPARVSLGSTVPASCMHMATLSFLPSSSSSALLAGFTL